MLPIGCFAVHFDYFIRLSMREDYQCAMGDVLLEREFNYLLYGILHVLIGLSENQ